MKQAIRPTISVILIALSVLGLLNVYSDNSEVETMARSTACNDCKEGELQLTQLSRSPLAQTFHFQSPGAALRVIECSRAGVFLGEYSCVEK